MGTPSSLLGDESEDSIVRQSNHTSLQSASIPVVEGYSFANSDDFERDGHGVRFHGLDGNGNGLDREFQDEPTGQRLHRRDTPHHLKNKRIHQQDKEKKKKKKKKTPQGKKKKKKKKKKK